ncbi:hypothetical protein E2C01_082764 [Portunus trituberculatus]|uniref:Uncharacterized protein n=1 Tax=Portunus trituberculatus TaxID=210409 RepID=A0A5B7J606_PORTR|nr:hypothetical protein [Portunus trituberculatus]
MQEVEFSMQGDEWRGAWTAAVPDVHAGLLGDETLRLPQHAAVVLSRSGGFYKGERVRREAERDVY